MIIWRIRPLANDHPEDSATCKWSSGGTGHLQMIIQRMWPLANDHPEDPVSCKWSSGGTGPLQMNICHRYFGLCRKKNFFLLNARTVSLMAFFPKVSRRRRRRGCQDKWTWSLDEDWSVWHATHFVLKEKINTALINTYQSPWMGKKKGFDRRLISYHFSSQIKEHRRSSGEKAIVRDEPHYQPTLFVEETWDKGGQVARPETTFVSQLANIQSKYILPKSHVQL